MNPPLQEVFHQARLTRKERLAYTLRVVEHRRWKDIATLLGVCQEDCRRAVSRANTFIRRRSLPRSITAAGLRDASGRLADWLVLPESSA